MTIQMRYVLSVREDGRAWILGGGHDFDERGRITACGDYNREADPNEIVDGKPVRDYAPGTYPISTFKLEV